MGRGPIRVDPATSIVHLDFAAREDVLVQLTVADDDQGAVEVVSAVGRIVGPAGAVLHEWSAGEANLTVNGALVTLITTRVNTSLWYAAWGDASWWLEVTDPEGRVKRVCEGDVRVRP